MSLSVNTNSGALMALREIQGAAYDFGVTQSRIATGLSVASPKDNGALFQIATELKSDIAGYKAIARTLATATSVVDVALAGAAATADILMEMREKAIHAADASLDIASRKILQTEFEALLVQLDFVADNAVFNDLNLLNALKGNNGKGIAASKGKSKGDPGFGDIDILLTPDGSVMTIAAQPMRHGTWRRRHFPPATGLRKLPVCGRRARTRHPHSHGGLPGPGRRRRERLRQDPS